MAVFEKESGSVGKQEAFHPTVGRNEGFFLEIHPYPGCSGFPLQLGEIKVFEIFCFLPGQIQLGRQSLCLLPLGLLLPLTAKGMSFFQAKPTSTQLSSSHHPLLHSDLTMQCAKPLA